MSKNKVVIDARMIRMSGIGAYIRNNILNGVYTDALGNKEDIYYVDSSLNVINYESKIYGIKEQLKFPYAQVKKLKPDVLHVPHYNVPIFYNGKMIVTIHDLIHLIHPEFLKNKFAYIYAKIIIGIALKKSDAILTVSESSKNDILRFYKHTNPDKIHVIYNDIPRCYIHKQKNKVEYLIEKYNIPKDKKLIMYVGNLKPHKNLTRLVEAFSKINDVEDTRLVLVGKAFDNYNLNEIEQKLGVADKIIHTGMVTDEEIIDFYNLVDLFVFPSLYEGFGLPPLEAMACGTPVIASNISSIPEVVGEAAHLIDPYNIKEITMALNEELSKAKEENTLVEKGYKRVEWIRNYNHSDKELALIIDQVCQKNKK